MKRGELIREFKTPQFIVIVDAIEEDSPDLSYDDTSEVAAKIDSGEYVLFCARARVIHCDAVEHAHHCMGCSDGWTVETLSHNIESSFPELDINVIDAIAERALGAHS